MSKDKNILEEANTITGGDGNRTKAYGSAVEEARTMTGLIKTLLKIDITEEEWYLILILMKMRRETNTAQRDNLVDIAGYARVIEIMKAENKEKGYIPR